MKGGAIIYSVSHAEGVYYCPTKREALRVAREASQAGDLFVSVQRHRVTRTYRSTRELTCALLNGESWAATTEDVDLGAARA